MTNSGRNHGRGGGGGRRGRGRGGGAWVRVDAAVDNGFRPSQEPRNRSSVKDDVVQDSNCRVPNNQVDEASIGDGFADRYNHPGRSQHGKTSPVREANSSSKCTQSATVVGSSYQQVQGAEGYYHSRRHQHGQTLPKGEANSSSKFTQSATVVGSSYQQVEIADGYYQHRRSQRWQTSPKRETSSSSQSPQSATVVGSSWQQDEHIMPACSVGKDSTPYIQRTQQDCTSPSRSEDSSSRSPATVVNSSYQQVQSAEGYYHSRRHQHGQTLPKGEANSSSKFTQSATVVGSSYQQVEIADGYYQHRRSQRWQTSPKRETNSSSQGPQSATVVGSSWQQDEHIMPACSVGKDSTPYIQRTQQDCTLPSRSEDSSSRSPATVVNSSYQQVQSAEGYYHSRRHQHGQTLPKGEANSSSKFTQSATVVGSSYQQVEIADGYYQHRRSQHWQTLPKRETNSSLKCTQSVTVVGSSWQQDEHIMTACSVGRDNTPNVQRTEQDFTLPNRTEDSSSRSPKNSPLMYSVNDKEQNVIYGSSLRSSQSSQLRQHQSNSPNLAFDDLLDRVCISEDMPSAAAKTHHEMISSEKAADSLRKEHSEKLLIVPFDICQNNKTGPVVTLKPSLLVRNREKRKEVECFRGSEKLVLRPGMVLLKKYISHTDQIKIVKKCQELGLGPGGFYQPGYRDGAKLNLHMMCLGKNWDPESRSYGEQRPIDDAHPPSIPSEFKLLVEETIRDSHALIKQESKICNVEDALPGMSPDICLVNFYTQSGRLGLHQDQDESKESIRRRLPVVSFSVGDSAEFLYGDNSDTETAKKVILESGDVLIFGGSSRLVYHGVKCIMPNSAPSFLVEEAKLRPGRINLTFRKS